MGTDSHSDREAARRRLMFVPGEDFYFLTYTMFIVLAELKSVSPEHALYDSRKIAYLADIVGSNSDLRQVLSTIPLTHSDRSRIAILYDRAAARHAPLERINHALQKRGFLVVTRDVGNTDRIHLAHPETIAGLINDPRFEGEHERVQKLRSRLPQLRTMSLATMKERLFGRHGVSTWGD